jgi:hypothetical protein
MPLCQRGLDLLGLCLDNSYETSEAVARRLHMGYRQFQAVFAQGKMVSWWLHGGHRMR